MGWCHTPKLWNVDIGVLSAHVLQKPYEIVLEFRVSSIVINKNVEVTTALAANVDPMDVSERSLRGLGGAKVRQSRMVHNELRPPGRPWEVLEARRRPQEVGRITCATYAREAKQFASFVRNN